MQIIFDKVNYVYSGGTTFARHAIKDVSFTIQKGSEIHWIDWSYRFRQIDLNPTL